MAGDLQPNESQCRVCEAESSVVSGRTAIYFEGGIGHRVRYQLALGVSMGACVLRGARLADGSGLARALQRSEAWERAEAREKPQGINRRQIISARAMESRMIRSLQQRGGGRCGGEAAE